jgi:GNAT superfamily N-acetyltransferase
VDQSGKAPRLAGPFPIEESDIAEVNQVFSEAFTERYHRDGLPGVRVPQLSPAIWRYAIQDAGGGAMLWRGAQGQVAAFNVAHLSGAEGWMGPLAVATKYQGAGAGKLIVNAAVEWLKERDARVIGLETMPRTMDNIGFYSQLGFEPGRLTVTVTIDAASGGIHLTQFDRLSPAARDEALLKCDRLLQGFLPGHDFRREIILTRELRLGETLLFSEGEMLLGFAICHSEPLVEGRPREELRVLKLVAGHASVASLLGGVADYARKQGARRVAVRVQSEYADCYRTVIALGGRVRWTDLRMTAPGFPERLAADGVVLSNWEI